MDMRADDGIQGQSKAMKRRGILTAAGAAVAAMMAKQASQPVSADGQTWSLPYTGNTNAGNGISVITSADLSIALHGGSTGNGTDVDNPSVGVKGEGVGAFGIGVLGYSSTFYGVSGYTYSGVGVRGNVRSGLTGTSNIGVLGQVGADGFPSSQPNTFAVYGQNLSTGTNGVGVMGQSDVLGSTGVQGVSANGFPIIGKVSGTGSGSNPAAGVLGSGTAGPGMQGQSTGGHGLVGTTDATDGHAGLTGNANHTGGVGLQGIAPNYGTTSVGKAGDFYGNVKITGGTLSAPVVQAVVPHAGDNTYRTLHTMVSPDGWAEDFGKGTLVADKAEIILDADFAALVHTDDYHVFLTPDAPQHLHVSQKSAAGFSVVAMAWATQAGGPKRPDTGSDTFSYRVVAKRKDITSERLAKVAAPAAPKVPTAFTIPETPAVKAPTKPEPPTTKP